jgi:mannose/fructose/N-acetylgalactosamine-specific phosphotransferase system component IIB
MGFFVRIDDRLIHGQVVEGWVNHLRATCILVADDAVAANELQRSIMELSVPQGLRVVIGKVEDICSTLRSGAVDRDHAILLFSNPVDVVRALAAGLDCRVLNIGGMHFSAGKRKLLDVLAVDEPDVAAFRAIAGKGVQIDIQAVPNQRPLPLDDILEACSLDNAPNTGIG